MKKKIYFVGLAGTGMASVAGLCKEAGCEVMGSDDQIYPPMSTMLETLDIPILIPYDEKNILTHGQNIDLFVIGNSLSAQHKEVLAITQHGFTYTSFPGILETHILPNRIPLVVAGTHGKTTTASLLTHVLIELGENPGFFIGGVPRNMTQSFSLGRGPLFVLEGDEYDTAFFDKKSKFLHYRPAYAIINNLEFDHADIFADLDAIKAMFIEFESKLPHHHRLHISSKETLLNQLFPKATKIDDPQSGLLVQKDLLVKDQLWTCVYQKISSHEREEFTVTSSLVGEHNWSNITQVLGMIFRLEKDGLIKKVPIKKLTQSIESFLGVKRRLELLAEKNGVKIFEDFAHHPTAVKEVIKGFRKTYPNDRLIVAFEPKNATSRRNIFEDEYGKVFDLADQVLLGVCPEDKRISQDHKMDTKALAKKIGLKALAFESHEDLLHWVQTHKTYGDSFIFMSSGSFSGIHHKLAECI